MQPIRFTDQFKNLLAIARRMTESAEAEAILLLLEGPTEWARLKSLAGKGEGGRGRQHVARTSPGPRRPDWTPSGSTCPTAPSMNG